MFVGNTGPPDGMVNWYPWPGNERPALVFVPTQSSPGGTISVRVTFVATPCGMSTRMSYTIRSPMVRTLVPAMSAVLVCDDEAKVLEIERVL